MSEIMDFNETHYSVRQNGGSTGSISIRNMFPLHSVTSKRPESPYGANKSSFSVFRPTGVGKWPTGVVSQATLTLLNAQVARGRTGPSAPKDSWPVPASTGYWSGSNKSRMTPPHPPQDKLSWLKTFGGVVVWKVRGEIIRVEWAEFQIVW